MAGAWGNHTLNLFDSLQPSEIMLLDRVTDLKKRDWEGCPIAWRRIVLKRR